MSFDIVCFRFSPEFGSCEIVAINKMKYSAKPRAFGFPKGSPFIELFSHFMKKLQENGFQEKSINSYRPRGGVCPSNDGMALDFKSCIAAFVLFSIGSLLSISVWFAERLGFNPTFLSARGFDEEDSIGKLKLENELLKQEIKHLKLSKM